MKKKILSLLLAAVMTAQLAGCAGQADGSDVDVTEHTDEEKDESVITQEFDFYSDDEHLILYNFPELYEVEGQQYAASMEDIEYETMGTRDTVQMAVDMNVEELEEIPETYTYESSSGRTYDLENEQVYIKEEGIVKIPVVEEVYYEDQVGKPSIPSKKNITYYDKASGSDKEIEGLLTEFSESTPGHWASILQIDGTFMAPNESCDVYELAGVPNVTVSRSAATPAWSGYEAMVLTSMGLGDKYYRINGTAWNGEQYWSEEGYLCRGAVFTGDMFVATYKAVYEAEREAQGYGTKVFYRADAESVDAAPEDVTTVYHIKAVVKYKLVE